jgi:hypothetical protein
MGPTTYERSADIWFRDVVAELCKGAVDFSARYWCLCGIKKKKKKKKKKKRKAEKGKREKGARELIGRLLSRLAF